MSTVPQKSAIDRHRSNKTVKCMSFLFFVPFDCSRSINKSIFIVLNTSISKIALIQYILTFKQFKLLPRNTSSRFLIVLFKMNFKKVLNGGKLLIATFLFKASVIQKNYKSPSELRYSIISEVLTHSLTITIQG